MRTTELTSATLGFDRTGYRLIVVEPNAVEVIDLAAGHTSRLENDTRVLSDFQGRVIERTNATAFAKARHLADVTAALTPVALPAALMTEDVLGGAVLEDGSAAVVVIGGHGQRTLALMSIDGEVRQRCAYAGSIVRLASRCALVAVLTEPRAVSFIDLHTGCEIGSVRLALDVDDLAIDPDGEQLAVRYAHGRIELIAIEPDAQIHPEVDLEPLPTEVGPAPSETMQWRLTHCAQLALVAAR